MDPGERRGAQRSALARPISPPRATTSIVTPAAARLDFVLRLGPNRGILAEVERGGTVNNHDLKDVWKAHIGLDAQHLFLVVPNSSLRKDGPPREGRSFGSSTVPPASSGTQGARSIS